MFLEAGGGAARRAQPAAAGFACGFALRAKSGAAVVGRWQRAAAGGSGLRRGDSSGLLRGQRAVLRGDGRQAVRQSRTPPPPPAGAGSAPEGRRACRPYCCGAQRPARKKTRPGKPQFSGPGLVLIDSPCARSGGVFPPGSGQGRWYRRGSW